MTLNLCLQDFSKLLAIYLVLNNFLALIDIGLLFDGDNRATLFEFTRCIFCLYILPFNKSLVDTFVYALHVFSLCCIWMPRFMKLVFDYEYEYLLMVQHRSIKVDSSLRNKLLYIMKSFCRSKHSEYQIDEFLNSENELSFSSNGSSIITDADTNKSN